MRRLGFKFLRFGVRGALALVLSSAAAQSTAQACGVSTADGLSACSLAEHEEATRPRWQVGVSGVQTFTAIRFGENTDPETRSSIVALLGYQPSPRLSLQWAAGATVGGRLDTPAGRYDFSSGPTAAMGLSWRAVAARRLFVLLTSNLSFSTATTRLSSAGGVGTSATTYSAFDLRLGGLAGTTLWHSLSLFGVGRVFGGPVLWRYQGTAVTGTDAHHYQLGAGAAVSVVRGVDIFLEGIPLGERALSAGAGFAF